MKPRHLLHRSQGQSIILMALAILLLVAVAGLGLDGANAFNQRRNTMNGADAAAMAGTNVVIAQRASSSTSNTPVCQSVLDYLNNHSLNQGANLTWTASYVDQSGSTLSQFCDSSSSPVAS